MPPIEPIIRGYCKTRPDISAAYLFGSHASGTPRPFSDVDIGILLNRSDAGRAGTIHISIMKDLGRLLRKDIHVVILNSSGETLLEQVLKKGKCLYVGNGKEYAEFQMSSFSRIVDFSRLREQMQKGLINRIMRGRTDG